MYVEFSKYIFYLLNQRNYFLKTLQTQNNFYNKKQILKPNKILIKKKINLMENVENYLQRIQILSFNPF